MEESNYEKLQRQIDELREQGLTDREFYTLLWRDMRAEIKDVGAEFSKALRDVADRLERRLDHFVANYDERLRQVEGRQRLKEQRFDPMLRGVASTYVTKEELQALADRVQRLEEAS